MINTQSTFQRKSFQRILEEQREMGYPRFKKGIAASLVEDYNVDYDEALRLAFLPTLHEEIMDDVAWAQHMGTEYWAEVIVSNHL